MSYAYQFGPTENEALAHFCRTCLQCTHMDTLVSQTMNLAAAEVGLDALALILVDDHIAGIPTIRVAARGTVAPNVRNRISAYCTHVIEDITGNQTQDRPIEFSQVNCSLPLHDVKMLTEARILWSIYLGPAERPWGALAFFASRECGIEPNDLLVLENICPIVEETVERIAGSAIKQRPQHGGLMATIRIQKADGHRTISTTEARNQIIDEVLSKVARILPRGSGLARLGEDTVGVLVPGNIPHFRENISRTLSEIIANHEADESIRIAVDVAQTISVEETSARSVFPTPTNQSSVQMTGVSPVAAARIG